MGIFDGIKAFVGNTLRARGKRRAVAFDMTGKSPAMRVSICTGEKVAGFRDDVTGHFEEVALIRSNSDMNRFLAEYGIDDKSQVKTFY